MDEDERPPWPPPPRPDLPSDEALDRLLRRLGPLLRWQEHEDTGTPEEERPQPDPAFERRLRARLISAGTTGPTRDPRRSARGRAVLWVGLAAAALAVMILAAVAVVEVGVLTALAAVVALVAVSVVLVVRARLGQ